MWVWKCPISNLTSVNHSVRFGRSGRKGCFDVLFDNYSSCLVKTTLTYFDYIYIIYIFFLVCSLTEATPWAPSMLSPPERASRTRRSPECRSDGRAAGFPRKTCGCCCRKSRPACVCLWLFSFGVLLFQIFSSFWDCVCFVGFVSRVLGTRPVTTVSLAVAYAFRDQLHGSKPCSGEIRMMFHSETLPRSLGLCQSRRRNKLWKCFRWGGIRWEQAALNT